MNQVEKAIELKQLRDRVRILEERVAGLRASRRILMNLVTTHERENRAKLNALRNENETLQRQVKRFARKAMDCNIRTVLTEIPEGEAK